MYFCPPLHAYCPWRPEEDADSLGWELQMIVNYHVILVIKPSSSEREASSLNC